MPVNTDAGSVASGACRWLAMLVGWLMVALLVSPVAAVDGQPDHPAGEQTCPGAESVNSPSGARACLESLVMAHGSPGLQAAAFEDGVEVPRWAMAFVLVNSARAAGVQIPQPLDHGFTDIAEWLPELRDAINQLAAMEITKGRTADRFDPRGSVSRSQMAMFFVRLLRLTPVGPGGTAVADVEPDDSVFMDLDGLSSEAVESIRIIYELGITRGTTASTYSPYQPVKGGQMAMFVTRLLAHTPVRSTYSDTEPTTTTTLGPTTTTTVPPSSDGSYVAFVRSGSLYVAGAPNFSSRHVGSADDFVWSSDGSYVAFVRSGSLYVAGAPNFSSRHVGSADDFVWSSDGSYVAFVRSGSLYVAGAPNFSSRHVGSADDFVWSSDGSYVAFVRSGSLYVAGAPNFSSRHVGSADDFVWSSDGSYVAFVRSGSLYVAGAPNFSSRHVGSADGFVWSSDGSYVAFVRSGSLYVAGAPNFSSRHVGSADDFVWSPIAGG